MMMKAQETSKLTLQLFIFPADGLLFKYLSRAANAKGLETMNIDLWGLPVKSLVQISPAFVNE